jgi:tetratricopeptide (TPR) repeat protein
LAQRAKALTMMGDIAQRRADLDGALGRYREAAATTGELLHRYPDDPQRLFDHSQNMFYFGSIAHQRGRVDEAKAAFGQYKQLADRMIALEPGRREYQLEGVYADHNLGVLLIREEERYPEAAELFAATLPRLERLIAAEPRNIDYQKQLIESLGYLADAQAGEGRLTDAIRTRERDLGLSDRTLAAFPDDTDLQLRRLSIDQALARLYLAVGQVDQAAVRARAGAALADRLLAVDRNNAEWLERAARAHFAEAEVALARENNTAAARAASAACGIVDRLVARDPSVVTWSEDLGRQCLLARARIALRSGMPDEALAQANEAIANVRASRKDTLRRHADLARARLFAAEALARLGRREEANEQWRAAVREWPLAGNATPDDLALRTVLYRRTGRTAEAERIAARLASIGYRHPFYLRFLQQESG